MRVGRILLADDTVVVEQAERASGVEQLDHLGRVPVFGGEKKRPPSHAQLAERLDATRDLDARARAHRVDVELEQLGHLPEELEDERAQLGPHPDGGEMV